MWSIDTYLDERTGYFFEINPSGAMGDGIIGGGGGGRGAGSPGPNNKAWDGIWTARVNRNDQGWSAEVEIPFKTLNFDPNAQAWGINFQRTIRRKDEKIRWNSFARNRQLNTMTEAGLVVGISEISQGLGLDVKPYFVGRATAEPAAGTNSTYLGDVGGDFFYNITPNLRANFTVNTDFAETEVDDRQVNLTRFPLRFREKREFFLQGDNFFNFSGERDAFFSRRIGLNDGEIQPIDFGLKLTGQMGDFDVGVLQVRTARFARLENDGGDLPGEDFTVFRTRRRFFQQSHLGVIYTRRAEQDTLRDARQTVGFDFRMATNRFRGIQNLQFQTFYVWTTNENGTGDSGKYGAMLNYPYDVWNFRVSATQTEEKYDPAIGFRFRTAIRDYNGNFFWNPRPANHPLIRSFNFGGFVNYITATSNDKLSHRVGLNLFGINFHSGDNFRFNVASEAELLDTEFRLPGSITLEEGGEFDYKRYRLSFGTSGRRVVSLFGNYEWGNYFSGTRRDISSNFTIRPREGVRLNFNGQWNRIELPEGNVSTTVFRWEVATQFSPWVSLSNNIQYDNQSRGIGWQARFRWILKPGNDIFFVYNHNWQNDPAGIFTNSRSAVSKVVFTRRF